MINDVSEDHAASKTPVSACHNTRCYNVEDSNIIFHCREPFQGHEVKQPISLRAVCLMLTVIWMCVCVKRPVRMLVVSTFPTAVLARKEHFKMPVINESAWKTWA